MSVIEWENEELDEDEVIEDSVNDLNLDSDDDEDEASMDVDLELDNSGSDELDYD
ncbi:hypothetical protein KY349_01570 [Candidatus Woesearchaeota archaeon]|jgi:hypothetical protein|nr:hypothetical protein [Candidatus Woesearchaeota archaeon]